MRAMRYRLDLERYIVSNGGNGDEDDFGNPVMPPIKMGRHGKMTGSDFDATGNIEDIGLKVLNGETDYLLGAVVIEDGGVTLRYFNPNADDNSDDDDGTACIWFRMGSAVVMELFVEHTAGEEPDRYLIDTVEQHIKGSAPKSEKFRLRMPRITEYHGTERREITFQTNDQQDKFWASVSEAHR